MKRSEALGVDFFWASKKLQKEVTLPSNALLQVLVFLAIPPKRFLLYTPIFISRFNRICSVFDIGSGLYAWMVITQLGKSLVILGFSELA